MAERINIQKLDADIKRAMIRRAMEQKAKITEGELSVINCCLCGEHLGMRKVRFGPIKGADGDYQNSRYKVLQDFWYVPGRWVRVIVCEPCNRMVFQGEAWLGKV